MTFEFSEFSNEWSVLTLRDSVINNNFTGGLKDKKEFMVLAFILSLFILFIYLETEPGFRFQWI